MTTNHNNQSKRSRVPCSSLILMSFTVTITLTASAAKFFTSHLLTGFQTLMDYQNILL